VAKRILTIDLPEESVSFDLDDVTVFQRESGISVSPKQGKEIGFRNQFFPWHEVRRVTEKNA